MNGWSPMARRTPISLDCSATFAIMDASREKKHRNMATPVRKEKKVSMRSTVEPKSAVCASRLDSCTSGSPAMAFCTRVMRRSVSSSLIPSLGRMRKYRRGASRTDCTLPSLRVAYVGKDTTASLVPEDWNLEKRRRGAEESVTAGDMRNRRSDAESICVASSPVVSSPPSSPALPSAPAVFSSSGSMLAPTASSIGSPTDAPKKSRYESEIHMRCDPRAVYSSSSSRTAVPSSPLSTLRYSS
mmetsp:Transcript_19948/g.63449  ORF Transcript_19948/g.63449 Transcript_19948/m.63449 type:complete len:243 (+) Transcript_19948:306-1034(+)